MDTDKPGNPGGYVEGQVTYTALKRSFGPLVTIQSETLYERQPLT
jgi:hypothetical protein